MKVPPLNSQDPNASDTSHSSTKSLQPSTQKIRRKRGSWPSRQITRVTLEQKAILVDGYFNQKKKIKDLSKELNVNYCTAKSVIHTHRKSIIQHDDLPRPRECLFRMVDDFSTINQPIISIVSILAEKVMSQQDYQCGQIPGEIFFQSDDSLSQKNVGQSWENLGQMDFETTKILSNQDCQSGGETQQGEIFNQQDFTSVDGENNFLPIVCSLEGMENFVERFLCIKDMEEELTKLGWTYFVEIYDDKAIFWYQQANEEQLFE